MSFQNGVKGPLIFLGEEDCIIQVGGKLRNASAPFPPSPRETLGLGGCHKNAS